MSFLSFLFLFSLHTSLIHTLLRCISYLFNGILLTKKNDNSLILLISSPIFLFQVKRLSFHQPIFFFPFQFPRFFWNILQQYHQIPFNFFSECRLLFPYLYNNFLVYQFLYIFQNKEFCKFFERWVQLLLLILLLKFFWLIFQYSFKFHF